MPNAALKARIPTCTLGGMEIARLSRAETADLMRDIAAGRLRGIEAPCLMTSANGQVISECARSPETASLFAGADMISADGQPMVLVSRLLTRTPIPDRAATTDLYHDVSMRMPRGSRYYLLGATAREVAAAVATTRRLYPHIEVAGFSHGYLDAEGESAVLAEIGRLRPDILWLALGVPREQSFMLRNRERLSSVRLVKTSGGLFNFLSGTRSRAPGWMQACGLEWLYRLGLEPRRLFARYMVTNVHSLYLMLTRTG